MMALQFTLPGRPLHTRDLLYTTQPFYKTVNYIA